MNTITQEQKDILAKFEIKIERFAQSNGLLYDIDISRIGNDYIKPSVEVYASASNIRRGVHLWTLEFSYNFKTNLWDLGRMEHHQDLTTMAMQLNLHI